jgi:HEAT repeats
MPMYSETSDVTGILENDEELWVQEVAVQIAESGPSGVRFLISSVPNAAEWRLRAILLGLSAVKKPSARLRNEICDTAKQFLHDDRPTIVAEAVDLLCSLDCTDAQEVIMSLRRHPSPYVVGSVLRYMARHFPETAIPLLEKALASKQSVVRQNAIDELDELNCVQALPNIKRLLRDKNPDVRQAARTAVKNLEG